ncbi:MAG TPA: 6-phosphogluconolactonase [Phycisphaerae bacterium]|nr:6-phosphogluconolactonase [Phycisphaerae bacterium]
MSASSESRRVIVKRTAEEAAGFVADLFKTIACEAAGERGVCRVALAGGTTPRGLYGVLARQAIGGDVPWNQVEIFFGDERDVPHDHVESNFGMAQRTLLDHLPIPVANVHPMPADSPDLEKAAAEYEQTIRKKVTAGSDGMPRFDLILLGMGGDGHVASLFPSSSGLQEGKKLVLACFVPVLSRRRMTFTFPLINAARYVILLVTGDDKAAVVARVLGGDAQARKGLPAAGVNPKKGVLFMVLDAAAARSTGLRPE